jgi:hypothetical protein
MSTKRDGDLQRGMWRWYTDNLNGTIRDNKKLTNDNTTIHGKVIVHHVRAVRGGP